MIKRDTLAKYVAMQIRGLSHKNAREIIDITIETIKEELAKGEKVTISSFGTLTPYHKKDRKGRNPQNGSPLTIPARNVVRFKVSPVLAKLMNEKDQ